MNNNNDFDKRIREIISKDKWWEILSRFIDVLRINIYIVDYKGSIILPPDEDKYGGRLYSDPALGFDLQYNTKNILRKFNPIGNFFECENRYGLYTFAIPIKIEGEEILAYMIVGPVILNRRKDALEYRRYAQDYGVKDQGYISEINDIRVVSNLMMNSILDLLAEIVRDNIDLSIKEKELQQLKVDHQDFPQALEDTTEEIYTSVHFNELLITLLDIALKITNTECGSIMIRDDEEKKLIIRVSRGLKPEAQTTASNLGEGIAGIAAKDKSTFIINGQEGDSRIQHLLSRPDIKEALVMPLVSKNRVFGVLNLHTKKEDSSIEGNLDNLQYLSKLIAAAV